MPEKFLRILTPFKCQIIDQIYFGMKCLHHFSGKKKLTLDTTAATQGTRDRLSLLCTNMGWSSTLPALMQNVEAASA